MGARAREIASARHDSSRASEVKKNAYRELLTVPKTSRNESADELRNRGARRNRANPSTEIRKANPWYTEDQFAPAQGHQGRTIHQRYQFIRQGIKGYLEGHPVQEPLRILDAGCGDGVQLQALADLFGKGVWGIDYNLLRVPAGEPERSHSECHLWRSAPPPFPARDFRRRRMQSGD